MAETSNPPPYKTPQFKQSHELPRSHKIVKAATAATAGGSLFLLSGLTMAAAVIGLAIATPLFVIFSPVLVPAAITAAILITGFLASGGFGITAAVVLTWFFSYVTGKRRNTNDEFERKGQYGFEGKQREKWMAE